MIIKPSMFNNFLKDWAKHVNQLIEKDTKTKTFDKTRNGF